MFAVQGVPGKPHAQSPPTEVSQAPEQQLSPTVHSPFAGVQKQAPDWQIPVQHAALDEHALFSGVHVDVAWHWKSRGAQVNPGQQLSSAHDWFAWAQLVSVQTPPVQVMPPSWS